MATITPVNIILTNAIDIKLATPPRTPPTDDEFVQAVESEDDHLVKYWLALASNQALHDTFITVCELGMESMAALLSTHILHRLTTETHKGATLLLGAIYWGNKAAAINNYRGIVIDLMNKGVSGAGAALGACVGGHADLFELVVPVEKQDCGIWLRWALEGKHRHMYDRLINLVVNVYGLMVLDGIAKSTTVTNHELTTHMRKPVDVDEIRRILSF